MEEISSMISAIILAKNEQQTILQVLKRLSWTDEQIVVDNGSIDNTVKIANENGAKTVSIPEKDFSKMRNEAAKKSKADWLLYIDTDEEISPALQKEIIEITKKTPDTTVDHVAYTLKRKNYYLGHLWPYTDGMIRLIYKPSLFGWFGDLHETAKINGSIGTLQHLLIHKTHRSLEEMLTKTNEWSEIEAKLRFDAHHPLIVPWRLFRVMVTGFYDSYLKQGGWKAGTVGIMESMYQGFSLFITYAKLWEMQQKSTT